MKKFLIGLASAAVGLALFTAPIFAAKPGSNNAGAITYGWHLSGAVMPVPPYGSLDIPGSDTASKLIVNQPNGAVKATITGVMNGLNPNTEYTVYLSNGYTPYLYIADVTGAWDANFVATVGSIGTYPHHMDLTQTGGVLKGSGYYIPATQFIWVIDSGSVTGNHVTFHLHYTGGHPDTWTTDVDAYVQNNGTLQGTWVDSEGNSGTVTSYTGSAVVTQSGSTGWPGLFTNTIQPFTFTTDELGAGSWHLNLRNANFPEGTSPFSLSVWINGGGATILISDNFAIVK